MAGSTYGTLFRLTTFGESHGPAIGGVIEGFPSRFEIDFEQIREELNRRRPGQSKIVTQRKEADEVEFLSGIFEGKTTGTPIGFLIKNTDQRATDYSHLRDVYRPSHADYTYQEKYGIRDHQGGGRSSARETACRVVAGALAKQFLAKKGISIQAYVNQVGKVRLEATDSIDLRILEQNPVRCPNKQVAEQMQQLIEAVKKKGDTIGGSVFCQIDGVPKGLGEPVFDKLHAELGKAMLSINAVKGFELGSGFSGMEMSGSEHNDLFLPDGKTKSNYSGGIQGGISNGMPIYFRTAFKPVATLLQKQPSINAQGEELMLEGRGRHDACVVPRAVPIVEAMSAIVLMDFYLRQQAYQANE